MAKDNLKAALLSILLAMPIASYSQDNKENKEYLVIFSSSASSVNSIRKGIENSGIDYDIIKIKRFYELKVPIQGEKDKFLKSILPDGHDGILPDSQVKYRIEKGTSTKNTGFNDLEIMAQYERAKNNFLKGDYAGYNLLEFNLVEIKKVDDSNAYIITDKIFANNDKKEKVRTKAFWKKERVNGKEIWVYSRKETLFGKDPMESQK